MVQSYDDRQEEVEIQSGDEIYDESMEDLDPD